MTLYELIRVSCSSTMEKTEKCLRWYDCYITLFFPICARIFPEQWMYLRRLPMQQVSGSFYNTWRTKGFRFKPTDEELVGFYLLRKVEGKSIRLELIRHVDIYNYDPWDLPSCNNSAGDKDKEWYFFCMRGRKYRNSTRPNRVTVKGCGFWKATGIDKPVYSSSINTCIGLKKSLVYYIGGAGRGTKTDWMMHEFRLPPDRHFQESAEVWTVCRIFKRNASNKMCTPNWKQTSLRNPVSSQCSSLESAESSARYTTSFKGLDENLQERSHFYRAPETSIAQSLLTSPCSSPWSSNRDELVGNGNWDELGYVVEFAMDRSL